MSEGADLRVEVPAQSEAASVAMDGDSEPPGMGLRRPLQTVPGPQFGLGELRIHVFFSPDNMDGNSANAACNCLHSTLFQRMAPHFFTCK